MVWSLLVERIAARMRAYLVNREHTILVVVKVTDNLLCVLKRQARCAAREDREQLLRRDEPVAVKVKGCSAEGRAWRGGGEQRGEAAHAEQRHSDCRRE